MESSLYDIQAMYNISLFYGLNLLSPIWIVYRNIYASV